MRATGDKLELVLLEVATVRLLASARSTAWPCNMCSTRRKQDSCNPLHRAENAHPASQLTIEDLHLLL